MADLFRTNLLGRRVYAKFDAEPTGEHEGEVVSASLVDGVLRVYVARMSDGLVEFCRQGEYRLKFPGSPTGV